MDLALQTTKEVSNYSQRFLSLDVARGLAIILMIEAHVGEIIPFGKLSYYCGILAAPFFLVIAGVGYELFYMSRTRKKVNNNAIILETIFRALILFFLTTVITLLKSIFVPNTAPFQLFDGSVFKVIAIGYLIAIIMPKRLSIKIFSIPVIFISTIIISNNFSDSLSFLFSGAFPILPWLAYFIFGQVISEIYKSNYTRINKNQALLILSSMYLIISALIIYLTNFSINGNNRGHIPAYLLITSLQFILLIILMIIIYRLDINFIIFEMLAEIGLISFSVWYIQGGILYLLKLIIKLQSGIILQPYYNLFIFAGLILCLVIFEKVWKKYDYIFGLEWILRSGSKRLVKIFV